jgi:hypothetical protein
VNACQVCAKTIPEAHGRRYCSQRCKRRAEGERLRERQVEEFVAAAADVPKTGDRAEVLGLLTVAAKLGSVAAMKLLLEELRRGGDEPTGKPSVIDELAAKRDRRT